jgi:hypothetical protein
MCHKRRMRNQNRPFVQIWLKYRGGQFWLSLGGKSGRGSGNYKPASCFIGSNYFSRHLSICCDRMNDSFEDNGKTICIMNSPSQFNYLFLSLSLSFLSLSLTIFSSLSLSLSLSLCIYLSYYLYFFSLYLCLYFSLSLSV